MKRNVALSVLVLVIALLSAAAASAQYCNPYCYNGYNCCNQYYYYPQPVARDRASFVADITIADGSYVAPGSTVVKTWRIRNTGTTTWDRNYKLVFVSGDQLGAQTRIALTTTVAPGQTVDLSVTLSVPSTSGSFKSNWMLENASGVRFGVGSNGQTPFYALFSNYYAQPTYTYNYGYCYNDCWRPQPCVPNFPLDGNLNPKPGPQFWPIW